MKAVLLILSGVVAVIVLVVIIGALLPSSHVASREIVLRSPPRTVYQTVRDFEAAPSWRSGLERVEILGNVDGHYRFREHSKQGVITYELTEDNPPDKIVTRIVDRDLGYFGTWTYQMLPAEQGTHLRITENGEVPNVLFRFLSRFVFGHTATMEGYLRALGRKFGEEVTPK